MNETQLKEMREKFNAYLADGYSRYRAVELVSQEYTFTMSQTGKLLREGCRNRKADTEQLRLF